MRKQVKVVNQEVVVNQLNSAALSTKLTNAIAIREYWSANEELRSNMKLYEILSRCYEVYDEYMSAKDKRQWKADFYDAISSINEDFKKYEVENKLTLTIVRVVFGDSEMCRKRVSTYAKVLRVAGDNASETRVKVSELAEWIAARGGVQEVSKSEAARVRETTDKVAHVQKRLRTLGNVEKIEAVSSVDLVGNYMVLLVSAEEQSLSIKHVFKDADFVNSVLRRLYSEYKSKDESHENTSSVKTASVAKLSDQLSDFQKLAA